MSEGSRYGPTVAITPSRSAPRDLGRPLQHMLRLLHDLLSERRKADVGAAPLEDRHPQLLFQLFDGQAQRGLRDKHTIGGPFEVAFLRQGDDVLQLGEGHYER